MHRRIIAVRAHDDGQIETEGTPNRVADHHREVVGGATAVIDHEVAGHLQRLDFPQAHGCQRLAQRRHLQGRGTADPADERDDA